MMLPPLLEPYKLGLHTVSSSYLMIAQSILNQIGRSKKDQPVAIILPFLTTIKRYGSFTVIKINPARKFSL
jgi:hypothetical protein